MDLQLFCYSDSYEVRVKMIDGKPFFCAKDVCDVLQLENVSKAVESLKNEQRAKITISYNRQGRQLLFVSEAGLYKLIFKSRTVEAQSFQEWVCEEVLPQIRETGEYHKQVPQVETDEKYRAELALKLLEHPLFKDDHHFTMACRDRLLNTVSLVTNAVSGNATKDLTMLATECGYSLHDVEKYRIRLGMYLAKRYKEHFGEKPLKTMKVVNGACREVNSYDPEHYSILKDWIHEFMCIVGKSVHTTASDLEFYKEE